ncbi:lipopolysaccharide biosynthesis protein [Tepidicaulis sp. LMO-SS28]|uniref:lipopolysaccharide biosynthesis protein n=1 Tax=Tepidicaulis sp. LMO-SS28 TaxID=3447455 RepID=UPI003EE19796
MIRSAFLAALDNAAMLTGKIAALLLFTWIIGPEAQGAFTLFLTTHVLIVVAASLGFGTANNYFLAKTRSARLRAAYLGNTLLVSLLAGGLSTAAFYFIGNSIGVFSALSETLLQLLLLSLVPGVLNALTGSFLFGRNRFGVHLTGTCIHNTVFVAGLVTEAIAGTLSAETGMGWWTLGLFLSTLFWLIAAWREIDGLPFLHLQTLKRQTRYALKAYPYFVMSAANYRLDNFIVAGFLDLSALGVYSIAVASVEVFLYVSRSLVNATLTHQAANRDAPAKNILKPLTGGLVLLLPAALSAPPIGILIVFGFEFAPAAIAALLLLPGIYAMAIAAVGSYALFARQKNAQVSIAAGLGMAVTIATNLILVQLIGIYGAAIATSLSYSAFCFYVLRSIAVTDKMPLLSLIRPEWTVLRFVRDRLGLQRAG